ncbi:hypothetical protein [Rhodococcus qingshengii]|uniref:hypothetical protein n=1 Tax=Rhodococcus qingshengii TaxID=334542 RepID=UPI003807964E
MEDVLLLTVEDATTVESELGETGLVCGSQIIRPLVSMVGGITASSPACCSGFAFTARTNSWTLL